MLSLRSITGKRITRESTPQMALSVTVPGSRVSSSVGIFFSLECRPIFEENMFHPSLKSNTNTIEIEQDNPGNESVDMFSSFVTAPASPGMESLIQEQNEAAKLIPKNVRFNRAYDVCKVVAEAPKQIQQ